MLITESRLREVIRRLFLESVDEVEGENIGNDVQVKRVYGSKNMEGMERNLFRKYDKYGQYSKVIAKKEGITIFGTSDSILDDEEIEKRKREMIRTINDYNNIVYPWWILVEIDFEYNEGANKKLGGPKSISRKLALAGCLERQIFYQDYNEKSKKPIKVAFIMKVGMISYKRVWDDNSGYKLVEGTYKEITREDIANNIFEEFGISPKS